MPGKLYLIPNVISSETNPASMMGYVIDVIKHIRVFLAEDEKSARRLLKKMIPQTPLEEYKIFPLNEHTLPGESKQYIDILANQDVGIISEAGCPCVADPGADVVLLAHQKNVDVVPLVGPSSIILALMASGLNGQRFSFHGYLPKDKNERTKKLKNLEDVSLREKATQIFMETPYRNQSLLEEVVATLSTQTMLCVACDLTGPTESIKTLSIKDWQKIKTDFQKRPALFLIQKF